MFEVLWPLNILMIFFDLETRFHRRVAYRAVKIIFKVETWQHLGKKSLGINYLMDGIKSTEDCSKVKEVNQWRLQVSWVN